MIEVRAQLNNVRVSPKKMRLVANAIRGLAVEEALVRLAVIFKRSTPMLEKLLRSAMANFVDRYEIKPAEMLIKSIVVNEGVDLKRWRPAAFGSSHPYKKHASHVTIVLTNKPGIKVVSKDKKKVTTETVDLAKVAKKVEEKKEDKKDKSKLKKD